MRNVNFTYPQLFLFLGYVNGANGVAMDEEKLSAVKNWPVPHMVKELQCYLGFVNFY